MAEVDIRINGRQFSIACDDGQEQRVVDLANFVDGRVKEMAAAGAGTNESHLLVLTSIVMADELFNARDAANSGGYSAPVNGIQITRDDESNIIKAVDDIAGRVESMTGSLQKAG
jgi:cell division protein ZapA